MIRHTVCCTCLYVCVVDAVSALLLEWCTNVLFFLSPFSSPLPPSASPLLSPFMKVGVYADDGAIGGTVQRNIVYNPKLLYKVPNPDTYNDPNHWSFFVNGGRDWTHGNNMAIDTPLYYNSGAGITWNTDMQVHKLYMMHSVFLRITI